MLLQLNTPCCMQQHRLPKPGHDDGTDISLCSKWLEAQLQLENAASLKLPAAEKEEEGGEDKHQGHTQPMPCQSPKQQQQQGI